MPNIFSRYARTSIFWVPTVPTSASAIGDHKVLLISSSSIALLNFPQGGAGKAGRAAGRGSIEGGTDWHGGGSGARWKLIPFEL